MASVETLRIRVGEGSGEVTGLLSRPADAGAVLVLAHGAGADMRHAFMEGAARELAARAVATLRFQFPYTEQGRRAPSPRPVLLATVRAAVAAAAADRRLRGLPLFAGGKSMGGRMTSLAAAAPAPALPGPLLGLVFFGFPLHPAGKPDSVRAEHLAEVALPMLFLQGTRDKLADLELLRPVCDGLGARAHLHVVEGADHGFHVPKRSGRSDAEILAELCDVGAGWILRLAATATSRVAD